MRGRVAVALALCLILPAPAAAGRTAAEDYLASKEIPPPRDGAVTVCHRFGCAERTTVRLKPADLAALKRLFANVRTAAAERAAVGRAVALIERQVAPNAGTAADRGGLDPLTPEPGQLDCIDEATNTTSYLVLLDGLGLLRRHQPDGPAARGLLFDLRYPHQTAVMTERGGTRWAVDSWPRPNGEEPDIMPLARWRAMAPRLGW